MEAEGWFRGVSGDASCFASPQASSFGGAVERNYQYRPLRFFPAAYVVTWMPWFLAVYAGLQKGLQAYATLFNLVGLMGPFAVALFLILTSGGKALKSDFKDRILNLRRIRPTYLTLAIAMPFTVMCLSIWLSLWFGQSTDQFRLAGGANLLAMMILAIILAPLLEEMGWRGYGVDSLRVKTGMLKAFAALWSAWHAPLMLIGGTYQNQLARMDNPIFLGNFFVSIIPAAIIANWLYYKNNRSIGAAVVLHSMLNAASVLLNAGQVAKCIATILYAATAAAIIAIDRTAFAESPRNFLYDAEEPVKSAASRPRSRPVS
jgi:membrane protease YdiL (CAAX protease family)